VSAAKAGLFNRGINGLLRGLVGALNSERGPYAQDPAAAVPPLPLLDPVRGLAVLEPDSDEARFMTVDLVRARNRVDDLVRQGTNAARQALEGLR
jgi:N-acetylated-alpha-linked acidic dipeptidase